MAWLPLIRCVEHLVRLGVSWDVVSQQWHYCWCTLSLLAAAGYIFILLLVFRSSDAFSPCSSSSASLLC